MRNYLEQLPIIKTFLRLVFRSIGQKLTKRDVCLNAKSIGRSYRGNSIPVTPRKVEQFARCVQDRNPRYRTDEDDSVIAPPMFGVVPTMHSLLPLLSDQELNVDFPNLINVGQETIFFRALRPGDRAYSTSVVKSIVNCKAGQLLVTQSDGFTEQGDRSFTNYSTFYIRKPEEQISGRKELLKMYPPSRIPEPNRLISLEDCAVPEGQIFRYSKVSGDYDPFHYFSFIAKRFGYSTKFLQGTCISALAAKVLINGPLGGDPERLRRISLSFLTKVSEGDVLMTRAWMLNQQEQPEGVRWKAEQALDEGSTALMGFQMKNHEGALIVPSGLAAFAR